MPDRKGGVAEAALPDFFLAFSSILRDKQERVGASVFISS